MATEIVLSVASIWLGSLFTYAASTKLVAPAGHGRRIIEGYKLLPASGAGLVAAIMPYGEFATGVLILLTPYMRVGAYMAFVFGGVFALATGCVLVRGVRTSCGCSGGASERVTRTTVARALVMSAAAWALGTSGGPVEPTLGWIVFGLSLVPAAAIVRKRTRRRSLRTTAATVGRDEQVMHVGSTGHVAGT